MYHEMCLGKYESINQIHRKLMPRTIPTQNPGPDAFRQNEKPRASNYYNCLAYEKKRQLTENKKQVVYQINLLL